MADVGPPPPPPPLYVKPLAVESPFNTGGGVRKHDRFYAEEGNLAILVCGLSSREIHNEGSHVYMFFPVRSLCARVG